MKLVGESLAKGIAKGIAGVHTGDMNTTSTQTNTFDRMAQDDRFLGFGYIGGRLNALESVASGEWPADVAQEVADADESILELAADLGWDDDRLFEWANSKNGRWFADVAFGCRDLRNAMKFVR